MKIFCQMTFLSFSSNSEPFFFVCESSGKREENNVNSLSLRERNTCFSG